MSAQTDLCNAAVMLCGVGVEIASIDERSPEAEACKQFYDTTLERLAVKLKLPELTKRVALALVEEDPCDEFEFSYGVPSDCVAPLKIVSGDIPETSDTHIPFKRVNKDGFDVLWTNEDDAQLEYIFRPDNEAQFPPLFAEAFEYALAVRIAPRMVEDPSKLAPLVKYLEEQARQSARAASMNQHFPGKPPEAEQIRNR